jgi:hypothetical protein
MEATELKETLESELTSSAGPSNRSPIPSHTYALQSERVRPRPPPSNRSPIPSHTYALQSERVRPRPPPSNRTISLTFGSPFPCIQMRVLFSINLSITVMRITWWFCWTGAAEDGRAPTEERSRVRDGASDRGGRPRTDALRLKSVRGCGMVLLIDGGGRGRTRSD